MHDCVGQGLLLGQQQQRPARRRLDQQHFQRPGQHLPADRPRSGGTPAETIPAGDAAYTITSPATTGTAAFSYISAVNLPGSPQDVAAASTDGSTTATWNPRSRSPSQAGPSAEPTPPPSSTPCPEPGSDIR